MNTSPFLKSITILVLTTIFGFSAPIGRDANSHHFNPTSPKDTRKLFRYVIQLAADQRIAKSQISWIINSGFDIPGTNPRQNQIEVLTTKAGIDYLTQNQIFGKVIAESQEGMARVRAIDPRFLTSTKVEEKLRRLNQQFPQLTRLQEIGKSFLGKPIYALLISNTPDFRDGSAYAKPSVLVDGLHHAREVMTPEVVMDIADVLLSGIERRSPFATSILEKWQVWIIPMLNVDGSDIVWSWDNWWRKNAHAEASKREPGDGVFGVDINRNYPYHWNFCNGSSGSKYNEQYRGESAGSETETKAITWLANIIKPAAYLSYHSYGEYVLFPYGCTNDLNADRAFQEQFAEEIASLLPRDSGGGNYVTGTPAELLYPVDGDSMDHMQATYGALGFTFEVNQDFQPSYEIREQTLIKHRKAWGYYLTKMSQTMLTVQVINSRSGRAESVQVNVQSETGTNKSYITNLGGYFFKTLSPGRYRISARLSNEQEITQDVLMENSPISIVLR